MLGAWTRLVGVEKAMSGMIRCDVEVEVPELTFGLDGYGGKMKNLSQVSGLNDPVSGYAIS